MAALDLAGRKFWRLTVLRRVKVAGANNAMWECSCDCGNITIAAAANIGKSTKSCGCLAVENGRRVLTGNTHQRTHRRAGTPEYQAWSKMKLRCYDPNNPKYQHYGARGIAVCERWRDSFENFFADMGARPSRRHSIDRRDNDGHYMPENCRRALPTMQARNNRQAVQIIIDGQSKCVTEWCEFLGVPKWKPYEMIRGRGTNHDLPADFPTIEVALSDLYWRHVRQA